MEIQDIRVEAVEVNQASGLVLARGIVVLSDGRSRSGDAGCVVGDALPNGQEVETVKSALDVASARALQKALRMIGFDPVRAHEARKRGDDQPLTSRLEDEQRNKELKEIHALAEEVGLIVGSDKTKYYRRMEAFFDVSSSRDMSPQQRAEFIAILRGLKAARTSAQQGA